MWSPSLLFDFKASPRVSTASMVLLLPRHFYFSLFSITLPPLQSWFNCRFHFYYYYEQRHWWRNWPHRCGCCGGSSETETASSESRNRYSQHCRQFHPSCQRLKGNAPLSFSFLLLLHCFLNSILLRRLGMGNLSCNSLWLVVFLFLIERSLVWNS